MEQDIRLSPFSEDYLCPTCNFVDSGNYCSHCGGKLIIGKSEWTDQFIKRCAQFGYFTLEELKVQLPGIYERYCFSLLEILPAKIIFNVTDGQNGYFIQCVIIVQESALSESNLLVAINGFILSLKAITKQRNALPKKNRSKNVTDYVAQLSIRGLIIYEQKRSVNRKKFKGSKSLYTKTGARFSFLYALMSQTGAKLTPYFLWESFGTRLIFFLTHRRYCPKKTGLMTL